MAKRFWLMKSDPDTYGLPELKKEKNRTTCWDGVRNYQARNFMRDEMQVGDGVLFYHSRQDPPSVVATCTVVRTSYPDRTQFEKKSNYFDAKATKAAPRWFMVDIQLDREFQSPVSLTRIKELPGLEEMLVARKGSRLSIQPVTPKEWKIVVKAGRPKATAG